MAVPLPERVGVIVVHGIGEQKRFDYLSEMVRALVPALQLQAGGPVTVDINPGRAEQAHADNDTWRTDPPVTAAVQSGNPPSRNGYALGSNNLPCRGGRCSVP